MKYNLSEIKDGIYKIEIINNKKLKIILSNIGASIRNIYLNDEQITLSPKDDLLFIRDDNYFGKTIGRSCGRIKNATYEINGIVSKLEINDFNNNLHSGKTGLHQKIFEYEIKDNKDFIDVIFKTNLQDGEGGHKGSGILLVCYRIYNNIDTFEIVYHTTAIDDIFVNLTNHVYLNLSGNFKDDITNEELYINASKYGHLDKEFILDDILPVNKIYNFKHKHNVGKYINEKELLSNTNGYDNPFILDDNSSFENIKAALYDKKRKYNLNIYTTLPICHLYTNNFPTDYEIINGIKDKKYQALCLECEYLPNGINEGMKDGIIEKGKTLINIIKYEFKIK